MIDPTYVSNVLAWLMLWIIGGTAVRHWLSTRR
jgi:hypothetical protein